MENRFTSFKAELKLLEKKYNIKLRAGFINSYDDDNNLIMQDKRTKTEVYLKTLTDRQ